MTLPKSYLTSTKNVGKILDAIKAGQAPEKFTTRFLETLGFSNAADRLFINVLESLGFLRGDRTPTDRYFRFLDQTQSAIVLAEAIRDAYSDLFRVNKNAQKLTKSDIVNKFKTLWQGQLSASVLDKMAYTFLELSKHADFETRPPTEEIPEAEHSAPSAMAAVVGEPLPSTLPDHINKTSLGGLHYNIQIILPATRDAAVFDALFRSLKEHLL